MIRRGPALILAGLAALAVIGRSDAASVHLALASSAPARGAHLAEAPREIRLTFTLAPERSLTRVRLLDESNAPVALAPPVTGDSAAVVIATILDTLAAGTYRVEWQVAGTDGHPVRGDFAFTIAPGAIGARAPAEGSSTASAASTTAGVATPADTGRAAHHDPVSLPTGPGFDAQSPGYVVVRWLQFTALIAVIGAVAFSTVVLAILGRREPGAAYLPEMHTRAAALGARAAIALGILALARLGAQSYAMHGGGDGFELGMIAAMVTTTVWGWGWVLQVVGVVIALIGFTLARRERRSGWALAAVGAAALSITPALSGHAIASAKLPAVTVVADVAHVLGAGGWMGSLLLLLAVGVPVAMRAGEGRRGVVVASVVHAFSPAALMFAALLAITGLVATWSHVGFSAALWETTYGKVLLVKLGLLALVAAAGAWNWRRVRPALGTDAGAGRLRRSAGAELAFGALVLLVTAVLVATPPE